MTGYNSILKVGGSYGDLYGQTLKVNDQGRILVTSEGYPIPSGTKDLLGNSNPDFRIGFNNNFTYKDFSLSILIDGSFGGQVMSLTDMYLDFAGVSKESGEARNNGGVEVNGVVEGEDTPVNLIDAEKWYKTIGNGIVGEYMYDATTVRFRELSFGYSLPVHKMNLNFLKGVKLSFIGRNLFYFHRSAPYDPDITLSTGNGFSGVDMFAVPATRNLGLKLDVTL